MESPSRALTLQPLPQQQHSFSCVNTSIRRRRSGRGESANSPEFEFCNPEPATAARLHSADELFSDGFLLPLQLLSSHRSEPDHEVEPGPEHEPGPSRVEPEPESSALISSSSSNPILSASKRWKEIFKRGEKKQPGNNNNSNNSNGSNNNNNCEENYKIEKVEKKRENKERKNNSGNGNSSAELNINIWPFSRSRSAGNNSVRSKPASSRKVSSAPCSRSNSSGESKTSRRSWPSSPGRAGLHLGRASPVWQAKRSGPGSRAAGKGRALKLNVPVCIGYRQQFSCRSDDNGAVVGGGDSGGSGGGGGARSGGGSNGNLFGLRGLFSKKTSATVLTV